MAYGGFFRRKTPSSRDPRRLRPEDIPPQITGIATDMRCETTAREVMIRDFRVLCLSDQHHSGPPLRPRAVGSTLLTQEGL
jgi:hypothetical protein